MLHARPAQDNLHPPLSDDLVVSDRLTFFPFPVFSCFPYKLRPPSFIAAPTQDPFAAEGLVGPHFVITVRKELITTPDFSRLQSS